MSSKKLYVGSLAYSVNDDILKSLFVEFGTVESAKVISDYHTGRSKGFGFVEMSTEQEAAAAMGKLNGSTHEGRTLVISEARPMEGGGGRSGGGARPGPGGRGGRGPGSGGGFKRGGDRDRGDRGDSGGYGGRY